MRTAIVVEDGGLGSPAVGVWMPSSSGVHLSSDATGLLGEILQNGRVIPVHVPDTAQKFWVSRCSAGAWVSYGEVLVMPAGVVGSELGLTEEIAEDTSIPDGCVPIKAETDGTLYLRPDPAAESFVQEGQRVEPKAVLALIEVMKTFSPVRASQVGTVRRVLATDGASVEAGDVLFWMD